MPTAHGAKKWKGLVVSKEVEAELLKKKWPEVHVLTCAVRMT